MYIEKQDFVPIVWCTKLRLEGIQRKFLSFVSFKIESQLRSCDEQVQPTYNGLVSNPRDTASVDFNVSFQPFVSLV